MFVSGLSRHLCKQHLVSIYVCTTVVIRIILLQNDWLRVNKVYWSKTVYSLFNYIMGISKIQILFFLQIFVLIVIFLLRYLTIYHFYLKVGSILSSSKVAMWTTNNTKHKHPLWCTYVVVFLDIHLKTSLPAQTFKRSLAES